MQQPVPTGPLAVRWHSAVVGDVRAGALTSIELSLENAGAVAWRSHGEEGIQLAYHWLDERGNPIVWDGLRTALPHGVEPGQTLRLESRLRGPVPPGRYLLSFDLVDEHRLWFAEVGNTPLELQQEVLPRIGRALAARGGGAAALAAQDEPLVSEDEAEAIAYLGDACEPAPDWSRRVLDAHQEGYAVVGGSIDVASGMFRRNPRVLDPWAPGGGRVPRFPHPLVCPSVVRGVEPAWVDPVADLPAAQAPVGEPQLFDGRIVVRARPRSGRRRG